MRNLLASLLCLFLLVAPAFGQLATASASSAPTYQIPNDFLGLSFGLDGPTWGNRLQTLMGTTATGVDTPFRQLVTNLALTGPIQMRTVDGAFGFYEPPHDVTAMAQFYTATGSRFWFGTGMQGLTVSQAETQAAYYYANMPSGSILGIDPGNEPDAVTNTTYYANLSSWIAGIKSVTTPSMKFMFPSCGNIACGTNWNTPGIVFTNRGSVGATSFHYYSNGNTVTSGYLLTPSAYTKLTQIGWQLRMYQRAGVKARVGEMNTAYNGGAPGASNAFEAALWMLDNLLSIASYGADGVNIHGCWNSTTSATCNYYDPATIQVTTGTPNTFTLIQVWPVYYGLQAFQESLGSGNAKIYPVTVTAGTSSSVNAWDLVDSNNAERAVVINLDTTNSGNVNFTPRASYSSATCYTMTAPSYSSTTGVTIHGQTYDGSSTGAISGTYTTTTLTPSGGVFSIPLAVTQAQICKFNP